MKYPPETLTPAEANRLLKACSTRGPTGIRNKALIAVLYRTGMRIGEALRLHLKDIDRDQGTIRILHGKGDKARTVGIDAGALAILDVWLESRRLHGFAQTWPVFCTSRGTELPRTYIREMLLRLRAKAGITKRVYPHGFRHTHAYQLRLEKVDIVIIQRQLGHASLATTYEYLKHLAPKEVIDATRNREW